MANLDRPHGFRPIRHRYGAHPWVEQFSKVVGYGTAIFINDLVHRVADGSIEPWASATPGTTAISGVALNHGAASTATTHDVITDPGIICEAQDNSDTDGFAAADLGLNCNAEAGAGNATTKLSGHEIDESTINTTNSLDVHLERLYPVADNEHGAWSRIEVSINKHRYATQIAGV